MATFDNGESNLSIRTKINNVLQHLDGSAGEVVVNDAGADVNFRVESDTNANALFVDGGTGNVGIGTSSPATTLDVLAPAADMAIFRSSGVFNNKRLTLSSGGDRVVLDSRTDSNSAAAAIAFATGGTERMRIDSSGNVLIGTTSQFSLASSTAVGHWFTSAGVAAHYADGAAAFYLGRQTSDGAVASFRRSGTQVGSISVTTTATAYNTSSDYRLKEDVQPMVGASERLLALKPVNFAWRADGSRTDGFLAHEAQEVAPYAVTGEKDGEEMQAIDHSKLVPLLTAALQDALKRIEALEAK